MNRDIQLQAEQLNNKHRRKRIWHRILSVPVCIVVFITTYAMILPAITLESTPDTYCGIEEHIHGNECYETPGVPEHKDIKCSLENNSDAGEYIIHKHDSFCFNDSGELICKLPEQTEHTHTEECYESSVLVCAKEKAVIHQHNSDCMVTIPATEPQGLMCTKNEHKHTESCFFKEDEEALEIQKATMRASTIGNIESTNIEITDDISNSGCYKVDITSGNGSLEGKDVRFLWYKSTDGGNTYIPVEKKVFEINGNVVPNISDDGGFGLNIALDGGTITETQTSVKYKVTLMVDGVEYEKVSAEIENSTHQGSVLNGSFEFPDLTNHNYQDFVLEGTAGLYWKTTAENTEGSQSIYPSGSTTANDKKHYIEIIDTSGSSANSNSHKYQATNWHGQGSASDGKQYAEINAGAQGALYQTIATIPGTTMNWSVDHSGRNGTDTMAMVMMPESLAKDIKTQSQLLSVLNSPSTYSATVFNNLTAAKGTWTTHSGQYTIPEGQYETRFFFVSVSASGNNVYIGNHIDNIWFSQKIPPASSTKPYFTITKTVKGDLSESDLQKLSDKLTFELQRSRNQYSSANMTTVKTYKASEIGDWVKNSDGSWTLSTRISMGSYTTGYYYRIIESNAELEDYNLSASDTNSAIRLSSSTAENFAFTNTYTDTGRMLKLTKVVNASNTTGSFDFTISYTDASGNMKTESISLQHNGTTRISGIKKGSSVTVTENSTDGYTVTMKDDSTGKILSGSNSYNFKMSDNADITVYNTTSIGLPETGGVGTYFYTYGGMGIMLTAVVAGYLLRLKYEKEGN